MVAATSPSVLYSLHAVIAKAVPAVMFCDFATSHVDKVFLSEMPH